MEVIYSCFAEQPQLQNTMAGEGQDTITIGDYLLERLSQIGVQAGLHSLLVFLVVSQLISSRYSVFLATSI